MRQRELPPGLVMAHVRAGFGKCKSAELAAAVLAVCSLLGCSAAAPPVVVSRDNQGSNMAALLSREDPDVRRGYQIAERALAWAYDAQPLCTTPVCYQAMDLVLRRADDLFAALDGLDAGAIQSADQALVGALDDAVRQVSPAGFDTQAPAPRGAASDDCYTNCDRIFTACTIACTFTVLGAPECVAACAGVLAGCYAGCYIAAGCSSDGQSCSFRDCCSGLDCVRGRCVHPDPCGGYI